mgnify:CR=1 FL=1
MLSSDVFLSMDEVVTEKKRREDIHSLQSMSIIIIINSYSSRTRQIWADIYNQRGRWPSWLLLAHIRQVREE